MLENIILWVIIGLATIYCGRNVWRVVTGRSKGCCGDCDSAEPTLQQNIPDMTDIKEDSSSGNNK